MWARCTITAFLLIATPTIVAHSPACAQKTHQPTSISLHDAIVLSLRSNPQVQVANLKRITDKYNLIVARNEFEPKYKFTTNGLYTKGEKPVYGNTIGTSLKLPTGTEFSVDVDSVFGVNQSNRFTYTIKQPLLRGAGIAVNLANLHNSRDGEKINKLALKETVMGTITTVIAAYNQIILSESALDINRQSLKDAEQTLHATKLQIKAGRRAGASINQQQTQVAQLRLLITRGTNTVAQNKRQLLVLLGLNPYAEINIMTDTAPIQEIIPSPRNAVQTALQFNTTYQQATIGLKQVRRNLMVQKNNQLWDLNLSAVGTKDLRKKSSSINDHRILLSLDIPIDDKPRKQGHLSAAVGLQQAKIALEDNKRRLTNAVLNGLDNLQAQKRQINIAKDGVKYAQKSLDTARKKFKYGRSSIFEVTTLRQTLTVSEQTLLNERIALMNTNAEFQRVLGVTLERWNVRVIY